jgi:hypothetical protein
MTTKQYFGLLLLLWLSFRVAVQWHLVSLLLVYHLLRIVAGIQLIINDISPSPAALGTLNGVALALQSGTRAYTPALFSSIYAIGVRDQILSGYLVWFALIAVTLILGLSLFWLPAKAEGRYIAVPQSDSEEN